MLCFCKGFEIATTGISVPFRFFYETAYLVLESLAWTKWVSLLTGKSRKTMKGRLMSFNLILGGSHRKDLMKWLFLRRLIMYHYMKEWEELPKGGSPNARWQGPKGQGVGGLRDCKRILKSASLGSGGILYRDNRGDKLVKAGFSVLR